MRLKRRAEQSTLWQEVRPVSPPAWQDDGREVLTCDGSGLSFSACAARLVPAGSWQRTLSESLASSLTGSTGCAVSLRVRATKCGRSLLVPTMLERPTAESACGLSPGSDWPTVTANESETRTNCGGSNGRVGPERPMLAGAVLLWGTPQPFASNDCQRSAEALLQVLLIVQVEAAGRLAPDSPSTSGKRRGWPTPNALDGTEMKSGVTPEDHDKRDQAKREANSNLNELQRALGVEAQRESGARGSLNPAWVSQLMGFPTGWLAASPPVTAARRSKPLETRSCPSVPRSSAKRSSTRKRG